MYIAHINDKNEIQTCNEHSKNTAKIAAHLLKDIGLSNIGYLSGLLHDMGKYSDEFLEYIQSRGQNGKRVIHSFTGVSFILGKYHDGDLYRIVTAEIIALVIGSHHGLFDIYSSSDSTNQFKYKCKKQIDYDKRAIKNFFAECTSNDEVGKLFELSVNEIKKYLDLFLSGYSQNKEEKKLYYYLSNLFRLILSAVVEGDRQDTASFMNGRKNNNFNKADWSTYLKSIDSYLKSLSSETEIQKVRMIYSNCCSVFSKEKGAIYLLDMPTGGGKTIASVRYAINHATNYGKKRIFYVAPLLTILEQNEKVIRNLVGSDKDILSHYSSIINEDYDEEDTCSEKELLQESWNSHIIITSLVQFLQTLFSGKMASVRRYNALANSVIIFDEIQSLPIKVYSMFNLTMNFLSNYCGATIVLCSATIPSFEKAKYQMDISNKKMISDDILNETKNVFRRTDIKEWNDDVSVDGIHSILINKLDEFDSILLVCNKKDEAQKIYCKLKEETSVRLFHLSASMCQKHRKDVLKDLNKSLQKKEKLICVSTQVIEAGIDISFSIVFRFAAGLDSVVQSAGRCNRNGESIVPEPVYVLKVKDENLKALKEIQEEKNALLNLLYNFKKRPIDFANDLASEASISHYYHVLFDSQDSFAQDFPNPKGKGNPTLFSFLSDNSDIVDNGIKKEDSDKFIFRQSFNEAGSLFSVFDNNQKSIVVPYLEEGRDIIAKLQTDTLKYDYDYRKKILERAKEYSVNVFDYSFNCLCKEGAIISIDDIGVFCLKDGYYSETGVSNKEDDECSTLIL